MVFDCSFSVSNPEAGQFCLPKAVARLRKLGLRIQGFRSLRDCGRCCFLGASFQLA